MAKLHQKGNFVLMGDRVLLIDTIRFVSVCDLRCINTVHSMSFSKKTSIFLMAFTILLTLIFAVLLGKKCGFMIL